MLFIASPAQAFFARHCLGCLVALVAAMLSSKAALGSSPLASSESLASTKEPPVALFWGECSLPTDPLALKKPEQWPLWQLCTQGETSQSLHASRNEKIQSEHLSRLYLGLHSRYPFSLHWQGYARARFVEMADENAFAQGVELATINFGQTTTQRLRFSLGRQPAAFGLNQTLPGAYFDHSNPSEFWRAPPYATLVTFDNLVDFTAELSLSEEALGASFRRSWIDTELNKNKPTLSARITFDHSAWYATRLLASSALAHDGSYKLGLGFLNKAPNGTEIQLEWVRVIPKEAGKVQAFRQVLRFLAQEGTRGGKSAFFLYDDVRFSHRLAVLGQKHFFTKAQKLHLSYAAAYQSDKARSRYRWSALLGLGAAL